MRVYIYEYAVATGDEEFLAEGRAMLESLLRAFAKSGYETLTVAHPSVGVRWADEVLRDETQALECADLTLVIAPESDGLLESKVREYSRETEVIGPTPRAIRVAADKRKTEDALRDARSFQLPTREADVMVSKPADGAGSEGVRIGRGELSRELIPGSHHSLLCVSDGETVDVLGINDQFVAFAGRELVYLGGRTPSDHRELTRIARDIAEEVVERIPGLVGLFGVDLVMKGGEPYLIEVNPRPTTPTVAAALEHPEAVVRSLLEGPTGKVLRYRREYVYVKRGAEALVPEKFEVVEDFHGLRVYRG
ncbi:ATP-grasp domain-containing protein [Methanopyrus kandleri]|uniref:Predicted ATP-utilizing enzymes of the ATP-grasp superfamily n=2 Tax=Methanopyrus kandleri TaxID=2320 RepID=Q8TZ26_METKA|nr:ATP-grasp domain-containing protein [Methanopyrus kandleri]AAM01331.1 Predicted ATP-utilizing enzymes of the ATP-grasp superfamily [Methanopyrus kandleri AV19]HII70746.1 ATP-grasp domain-containing protein [Methanopyrus kandleri]